MKHQDYCRGSKACTCSAGGWSGAAVPLVQSGYQQRFRDRFDKGEFYDSADYLAFIEDVVAEIEAREVKRRDYMREVHDKQLTAERTALTEKIEGMKVLCLEEHRFGEKLPYCEHERPHNSVLDSLLTYLRGQEPTLNGPESRNVGLSTDQYHPFGGSPTTGNSLDNSPERAFGQGNANVVTKEEEMIIASRHLGGPITVRKYPKETNCPGHRSEETITNHGDGPCEKRATKCCEKCLCGIVGGECGRCHNGDCSCHKRKENGVCHCKSGQPYSCSCCWGGQCSNS